ncbi:MAG: hypothetical protein KME11_16235 [Timaviella obliquedivisa GSE-PSE-MK23-08B]|jgi:hypothetical protein|nr:hypothetical protein [Timaviella obliquedivisa GSE-PSE-MK23-08B]
MLKCLGSVLCLSGLFAGSASSQSLSQEAAQYSSEPIDLVCYMETASGQVINLTSVCGASRVITPSAPAAPSVPAAPLPASRGRASSVLSPETNLGGLDVGGQDGSPLCFGVDAQGRACPFSPVTTQE